MLFLITILSLRVFFRSQSYFMRASGQVLLRVLLKRFVSVGICKRTEGLTLLEFQMRSTFKLTNGLFEDGILSFILLFLIHNHKLTVSQCSELLAWDLMFKFVEASDPAFRLICLHISSSKYNFVRILLSRTNLAILNSLSIAVCFLRC